MSRDWLWDRRLSLAEAKRILKNPKHKDFLWLAALLLARKNTPKEVFKDYIKPFVFCSNWPKIKVSMRKNKWNDQRIIFWQAIYESLADGYRKKGIRFRQMRKDASNGLCKEVGSRIRSLRKEQGLSQEEMARRLGCSQQLISRVEKGEENVSLTTLSNIVKALGKKVDILFS